MTKKVNKDSVPEVLKEDFVPEPPAFNVPEPLIIRDEPKAEVPDVPEVTLLKTVDGCAVVSVDVPAHTRDIPIAYSPIDGCAVAAVTAWDRVKGLGDAPFALAAGDHKQRLINSAEDIYKGGSPSTSDTTFAKFEREVARIKANQEAAK